MSDIREIAPRQYSYEEIRAARKSLAPSPWFIVTGLGLGWRKLPHVLCTCTNPDALLTIVELVSTEKVWHRDHARVCIEIKKVNAPLRSPIEAAHRIVSAIGGLFAHVHHSSHEFAPYQLPSEILKKSKVKVSALENIYKLTSEFPFTAGGFMNTFASYVMIPDPHVATIFLLLPFVLQDDGLFDACSFFRSCCSDYCLMDGVVSDVLYRPDEEPRNETERLALENVILQSFRIIEALFGEPGDEKKFRERMKQRGLDADEAVGFPGRRRQKLLKRILWLQEARDSAAAHGRRRRRTPFTMYEGMEAQHVADSILNRALWFSAESRGRRGTDDEIGFLLGEMHPDPEHPKWMFNKKVYRGKSAVDLARVPGGLRRVINRIERENRKARRENSAASRKSVAEWLKNRQHGEDD